MKLDLGMGGGAFKDEDKAMVASVLGTKALDDKGSSSVSKENLLTTICSDENLQNKLSGQVLWTDPTLPILAGIMPFFGKFRGPSPVIRSWVGVMGVVESLNKEKNQKLQRFLLYSWKTKPSKR